MALSDDEQRMLNLIAERMYQDDPKLATSLASSRNDTPSRKRSAIGVLLLLLGLGMLVAAIPLELFFLGPVGFLIALAGAVIAYKTLAQQRQQHF